ncbi:hypothetical protein ACN4EE_20695 [Geminocystis sp. CENA526]|uniref:hypothetical protein n=1 Tax=Geminocystis sp. CENA526 TaxID=1355871 RepID=UPI003D6E0460
MNVLELQNKIKDDLAEISIENLKIIAKFVEFIKSEQGINLEESINYRPASGKSILRHGGRWKGDDLEDCLQLMYDNREKVKVDNNKINPFI